MNVLIDPRFMRGSRVWAVTLAGLIVSSLVPVAAADDAEMCGTSPRIWFDYAGEVIVEIDNYEGYYVALYQEMGGTGTGLQNVPNGFDGVCDHLVNKVWTGKHHIDCIINEAAALHIDEAIHCPLPDG